jgi:AraC-like DNA-binding protein
MTKATQWLDRFPVVRTQDAEEMCAALESIYAKPMLKLEARTRKVDAAVNYYPMNCIGLGNTKYGTAVSFEYPESDVFLQSFPVRGQGHASVDEFVGLLNPDHSVTVSPHTYFAAKFAADYETLLLLIKPQALIDKLTAIIGQSIRHPLKFQPPQDWTHPAAKTLRDHFLLLVEIVGTSVEPIPKLVLAEFEQTLMVWFLRANRHNYSHFLEQKSAEAAPWQLRRAEQYMEANWQRPIMLEQLARVAGVSALALFRSFRKSRGCSPTEFLSRLRLRRAREMLQHPHAATTVAGVASACGFADLDRFVNDYLQAFGELPSQALGSS